MASFFLCVFSTIDSYLLLFSEATHSATNEKVIRDCSLYKGLEKQASKYSEAFQPREKKIQKGAGERGERKMDG